MDELQVRREIKKVMRYGVSKNLAKDIVDVAMSVSKNGDLSRAVQYALTLTYGLNFSQKAK